MRPKTEAQYACMRACYVRVHVGVRMGLGPCPLWLPFGLVLLASLLNIRLLYYLSGNHRACTCATDADHFQA